MAGWSIINHLGSTEFESESLEGAQRDLRYLRRTSNGLRKNMTLGIVQRDAPEDSPYRLETVFARLVAQRRKTLERRVEAIERRARKDDADAAERERRAEAEAYPEVAAQDREFAAYLRKSAQRRREDAARERANIDLYMNVPF